MTTANQCDQLVSLSCFSVSMYFFNGCSDMYIVWLKPRPMPWAQVPHLALTHSSPPPHPSLQWCQKAKKILCLKTPGYQLSN